MSLSFVTIGGKVLIPGWSISPFIGIDMWAGKITFGGAVIENGIVLPTRTLAFTTLMLPVGVDFSFGLLNFGGGIYIPTSTLDGALSTYPMGYLGIYF